MTLCHIGSDSRSCQTHFFLVKSDIFLRKKVTSRLFLLQKGWTPHGGLTCKLEGGRLEFVRKWLTKLDQIRELENYSPTYYNWRKIASLFDQKLTARKFREKLIPPYLVYVLDFLKSLFFNQIFNLIVCLFQTLFLLPV